MRILQISTYDELGGGSKIPWDLFKSYQKRGHEAWMTVGYKRTDDPHVYEIPRLPPSKNLYKVCMGLRNKLTSLDGRLRGIGRLRRYLAIGAQGWLEIDRELGQEDFHFPSSRRLLNLYHQPPQLIHAHNLHGQYFDLRILPRLSHAFPFVLTLHDAWLLSGHCAHSFDCDRWLTGCGHCPDLSLYPALRRDGTAGNWRLKQNLYRRSRLYITAPSHWLMQKAERSILQSGIVAARVIPNGIDLSIFHPGDRRSARQTLDLPQSAKIVLFVANGIRSNIWKDYDTMESAIHQVFAQDLKQELIFVCLGGAGDEQRFGSASIRYVGYQTNPEKVAQFYRAADIYLHAAKAETFGLSIAEALACGLPVVATGVGGIPEVIEDGHTGFVTPAGDSQAMATHIQHLLTDEVLLQKMQMQAAISAAQRFCLKQMVDRYLEWYEEILENNVKLNFKK